MEEDKSLYNYFRCPECNTIVHVGPCSPDSKKYTIIYPRKQQYQTNTIPSVTTRRQVRNKQFEFEGEKMRRFAQATWTPCFECQEKLQEMIDENPMQTNLEEPIEFNTDIRGDIFFQLRFLRIHNISGINNGPIFKPCERCQEKLKRILRESELIIGNKDYQPMVELFRKWKPLDIY